MARRIAFPLRTARFEVRPLQIGDAADLFAVYADPDTMAFLTTDVPTSMEEATAWVRAKMELHERTGLSLWAVVDRETGAVVGDAGLQYEREQGGDVGIGGRLNRRYWRRGYALEVGHALLEAGFADLGLDRIVGVTRPDNAGARAVCERLGMQLERISEYFGADRGRWAVYACSP